MDLSTAIANIARKLGNRTDLDEAIASEIQLAQVELENARELPWFLLDEEQYIDLDAGTTRVALPTGFLREYEEGALWLLDEDTGQFVPLTKAALDDLRDIAAMFAGEDGDTTVPTAYSLSGKYFHLAPASNVAFRLQILCYTRDETLSAGGYTTNDFLTENPELLIAKTGMRMAQWLQNTPAYAMFQSQYVEAAAAQEVQNTSRQMKNMELEMGGS